MDKRKTSIILLAILFGASAILLLSREPIPQDPGYHNFADSRDVQGIPNFSDVFSNAGFILAGLFGLSLKKKNLTGIILFSGILLTGLGSAYYHYSPVNETLLWDRLPMTILFMSFFVFLLSVTIRLKYENLVLAVFILAGIGSVLYWHYTEKAGTGDLRFYALIQFFPMLSMPFLLFIFRKNKTLFINSFLIIGWYIVAKLAETFDDEIFLLTNGVISGHTLKHLASSVATVYMYILYRKLSPQYQNV